MMCWLKLCSKVRNGDLHVLVQQLLDLTMLDKRFHSN